MAELTHRTLEWIPTAPVVVQERRIFEAPAARVFSFIADHEGWAVWFPRLDEVRVTGTPTGVGGERQVRVGKIVIDEEFIGWEDDRLFAFTITALSRRLVASMAESVQIEPLDDRRCQLTYTMGIEPRPRTGFLVRRAAGQMRKNLRKALAHLAILVESAPLPDSTAG